MSFNVHVCLCAADLEERLQHHNVMFLKKYTKTNDITVKISHIITFYQKSRKSG